MSYVLAIEPHQEQASLLRDNLAVRTRTKLTLVDSMDAAMTAIDDEVPNLVILNALIPPQEETRLIARLRELTQATAPQVLFIPALARPETLPPRRMLFDRFRSRTVQPAGCNPSAFADQVSAYFSRFLQNRPGHDRSCRTGAWPHDPTASIGRAFESTGMSWTWSICRSVVHRLCHRGCCRRADPSRSGCGAKQRRSDARRRSSGAASR